MNKVWHSKRLTASINTDNSEESLEDTTETFASKHTSRNSKHIHIIASGVAQHPKVVDGRSDSHGNGVVNLGNDKSQTDGVPVGYVAPVFFGDEVVLVGRYKINFQE